MPLIIDGYNLLNATGIAGSGPLGHSLAQSRAALLDFLADRLPAAERRTTTVVFDARSAPPGLAHTFVHRGMTVCFARQHREADDLIEELIRNETSPRRLTVVSSDHRLHRAALRRRATPVDSDVWFRRFARQPVLPAESVALPDGEDSPLESPELDEWLRAFGESPSASPGLPASHEPSPGPEESPDFINPFPPGYGEDLLRDQDP